MDWPKDDTFSFREGRFDLFGWPVIAFVVAFAGGVGQLQRHRTLGDQGIQTTEFR